MDLNNKSSAIRIAGIADDSIVDGPGIRVALFCQGCPRRCPGCHNPETQPFDGGIDFTPDELYARIKRNPLAHGVTFSGGEPFSQAAALSQLAARLRAESYELAAYTGYTFEDFLDTVDDDRMRLLSLLDVLVDGEFILAQRNLELRWRGSENQRILDVQQSIKLGKAVETSDRRWH